MKVTVKEESASERLMEIVVDAKRVEGAFQKAFKKNLKEFALPGFRRGKVPVAMAQRYITDAGLVRDVIEDLVPRAFQEATKENSLQPISQPEWDLVQNERGKDLIFKASFQVSPTLKIVDYNDAPVTQEKEEIGEEHINETLEKMRENHGYFEVVAEDRGLVEGDFATVDYVSSQNGEEIENGSVKNYLMELKKENYIHGFVENLSGLKAGEEKTFEVTFPEEYENEHLAGESVTFAFKVHDIKAKKYPELDDEFAKSHSEKDSIEELKASIKERLEEGAKRHADGQVVTQIVKTLLEQVSEDDIPTPLRQHHAQRSIRGRMYEMSQRGISLEQILQARGMSQDDWIKEMMGAGLFEARLEVLYRSIANAEKIDVSPKEIDDVIAAEAPSQKLKPKQLKAQMQKNGSIDLLEYNLLMDKVQKHLLDNAKITYVKPGEAPEPAEKPKKASKPKKAAESSKDEDDAEAPKKAAKKSASKTATKKSSKDEDKTDEGKADEDKAESGKAKSKPAKASSKKSATKKTTKAKS